MLATALSATLVGLQAHLVRVEVEGRRGPTYFELVGLAEAAVRESRVRVKSALAQVGLFLGECQVVVNLAPADVKKTGSGFDLALAAATAAALGMVPRESLDGVLFVGELSLEGTVQPLRGVLPQLLGARKHGVRRAIVPQANAAEAALVEGVDVRTAGSLRELLAALNGQEELPRATVPRELAELPERPLLDDLADVRGQAGARRAIEIACAGGHNLLPLCRETRRFPLLGRFGSRQSHRLGYCMHKRFAGGFIVRPTPDHDGRYVVYRRRTLVGGPYATRAAAIDAARKLSCEAAQAPAQVRQAQRLAHDAWKQVLRNAEDPWPAAG